jgi:hypothetical protein
MRKFTGANNFNYFMNVTAEKVPFSTSNCNDVMIMMSDEKTI